MTYQGLSRSDLENLLPRLPIRHCIAFAASCCERLLPNYEAFVVAEQWGNADPFRHAHELIWHYVADGSIHGMGGDELLAQCEQLIPDVDLFTTVFATLGLYAGGAITNSLRSCLRNSWQDVVNVSYYSVESTRQFVYHCAVMDIGAGVPDPEWEHFAAITPLMRAAMAKLRSDLRLVASLPDITDQFVQDLRTSNSRLGIRPMQRGLVKVPVRDPS